MRSSVIEDLQQLIVFVELVLLKIGNQHLARTQTAAMDYFFRIEVNQTGFGADDDQIVFGHEEPTGPKPVAIERSANETSVGKGERRRAVPRLKAIFVVCKESRVALVLRRRQQHPHGFRDSAPIVRK